MPPLYRFSRSKNLHVPWPFLIVALVKFCCDHIPVRRLLDPKTNHFVANFSETLPWMPTRQVGPCCSLNRPRRMGPLGLAHCNGGYFSETSLRPRIPPARPRDPVIHIKPQAPKARGYCRCCLIRIQVRNKEQSLSPEPRLNGEC